jgi:hypothetical protein
MQNPEGSPQPPSPRQNMIMTIYVVAAIAAVLFLLLFLDKNAT